MAEQKLVICPYCGDAQPLGERCRVCGGLFEPLSRQATHNAMGPWFVREVARPFQPGCSYETLLRLIERGRVTGFTIIRGPTTRQFWTIAKNVPGLAHLLGYCHQCDASVDPGDHGCHACGAPFGAYLDRNFLGLPEIRPLPWEIGGAEDVRSGGASGSMWRDPGEGPRTISSFVTDEELLGGEPASDQPLPPSFGGASGQGAAPAATAEPVLHAAAEHGPLTRPEPAARSTRDASRQQILTQRRTIRALWGVIILLSIATLGWFNAMFPADAPATEPQPAAAAGEAQTPSETRSSDGLDQADADALAPSAQEDQHALHERALGLIEAAEDAERPLEDRIADYEHALRLLESIKANAASGNWPDDSQQVLDEARQQLDQLLMKRYFPDPGQSSE